MDIQTLRHKIDELKRTASYARRTAAWDALREDKNVPEVFKFINTWNKDIEPMNYGTILHPLYSAIVKEDRFSKTHFHASSVLFFSQPIDTANIHTKNPLSKLVQNLMGAFVTALYRVVNKMDYHGHNFDAQLARQYKKWKELIPEFPDLPKEDGTAEAATKMYYAFMDEYIKKHEYEVLECIYNALR